MSKNTSTKTQAPAPAPAPAPTSGAETQTTASTEQGDGASSASDGASSGPAYPRKVVVTNNTPIPLYLGEARVHLPANFTGANTATVVYQTPDSFAREQANVDAIARVHDFTAPLLVEDAAD